MRFLEVSLQNFLSFGSPVTVKLDRCGLLAIFGNNKDSNVADSNGCLIGGTLIDCPRDLIKYPKGIPIEDLVGESPWVYCWDGEKIVIRRASRVWLTKENTSVVRVRLSKYKTKRGAGQGSKWIPPQELVGTTDHLVLLADGETWKKLGDLRPGDRVCSLYRRQSGGWRTLLHWTGHRKLVSEQQFVCSEVHGHHSLGNCVHHKNENKFDHSVDNLEWKLSKEHLSDHARKRNLQKEFGWQMYGNHPRGMLGKKHTLETRSRISATLREQRRPRPNHTVLSVEDAGVANVYDMYVPEVHNFVANGVVVHNSGKSALVEGIVWCLYGETMRNYKSDEVIHLGVGKDCQVSLPFEDDDGNLYQVTRTRKMSGVKKPNNLLLEVNGKDVSAGTVADTQQLIVTILGMDLRTFTQAVLLRNRDRSFSEMTDKEQKEVLEDILHIEELAKARDVTKSRISVRQSELSKVLVRLEDLEDQIGQENLRLGKMKISEGQHFALIEQKRQALRRRKVEAEVEIEEKYRATGLDVLLDSLNDFSERLTQEDKARACCHDEARKLQQSNATKKSDNSQQLGGIINQVNSLNTDVRSVSQLAGTDCPTCRQMVHPEDADRLLVVWDDQLKKLEAERLKIERRTLQLEKKEAKSLQGFEQRRFSHTQEIDKLSNQRQVVGDQIRKRENALQLICQLEQQVFNLQTEMDQLDSTANPFTILVEEIEGDLVKMSRDKRRWGYKSRSLDLELRHLLFWDHGFGNQGLKSYVLDNVVPFLTRRAQYYADILSGGDLHIEFSTQTQLKSGDWREQFQVKVTNRQGADVYAGNSDGEKRRIDIAVGWALGDLAATRAKKPIRFKGLDEVFSGLDETGEDAVIRLLHTVTGEYETVLCITHSDHLRSQFSNSLTVTKENGFSTVS